MDANMESKHRGDGGDGGDGAEGEGRAAPATWGATKAVVNAPVLEMPGAEGTANHGARMMIYKAMLERMPDEHRFQVIGSDQCVARILYTAI